jgi:hypothetical protein
VITNLDQFECSTKGIGGSNKKYQNQLSNRYPLNRYTNPALNQLFNPEFIENSKDFLIAVESSFK